MLGRMRPVFVAALMCLTACGIRDGEPRRVTIDSDDPAFVAIVQNACRTWNEHTGLRVFESVQVGPCTDEGWGAVCVRTRAEGDGGERRYYMGESEIEVFLGPSCPDLAETTLHELGHALMLDHDKLPNSIMLKACKPPLGNLNDPDEHKRKILPSHVSQVRDTYKDFAEAY